MHALRLYAQAFGYLGVATLPCSLALNLIRLAEKFRFGGTLAPVVILMAWALAIISPIWFIHILRRIMQSDRCREFRNALLDSPSAESGPVV